MTAVADQFLARLDQAIGLSNTLARALSGAARVLDGVRRGSGLLLPSEQEAGPAWFVPNRSGTVLTNGMAPGGPVINQSITIDARGADAGVEARLRVLSAQVVR